MCYLPNVAGVTTCTFMTSSQLAMAVDNATSTSVVLLSMYCTNATSTSAVLLSMYQRYKHISCTAQHVPTLQAHQLYCSAWTSHSFSEYRSQKSSFPAGLSFSDVRTRRLLADVLGLNGQGQFPSSPSGLGQLPCNKIYKAYRKSVLRENNPKNARRLTL